MTENLNTKIEIIDVVDNENCGKFVIAPLERGFGTTLGNSLRRVLLSSLPGAAITKVKIESALHELSTVTGVVEDISEIILNIKGIYVRKFGEEPIEIEVEKKGPGVLTAADFAVDSSIEIVNPDQYIATLNEDADINLQVRIENGSGYRIADLNKAEEDPIGTIAVDSSFTPVTKMNYSVENTRVGQITDFDKLTLEVWTNGTLTAPDAISKGADILMNYLELFRELPNCDFKKEVVEDEEDVDMEELYSIHVEELDLTLRSFNCLKRAGIDTVGDIVSKSKDEMTKIKNFGKKSLEEVEDKIHNMGLDFAEEE